MLLILLSLHWSSWASSIRRQVALASHAVLKLWHFKTRLLTSGGERIRRNMIKIFFLWIDLSQAVIRPSIIDKKGAFCKAGQPPQEIHFHLVPVLSKPNPHHSPGNQKVIGTKIILEKFASIVFIPTTSPSNILKYFVWVVSIIKQKANVIYPQVPSTSH